jgi:hypothetical protein
MKQREFIRFLGGAALASVLVAAFSTTPAWSQPPDKPRRVGVLMGAYAGRILKARSRPTCRSCSPIRRKLLISRDLDRNVERPARVAARTAPKFYRSIAAVRCAEKTPVEAAIEAPLVCGEIALGVLRVARAAGPGDRALDVGEAGVGPLQPIVLGAPASDEHRERRAGRQRPHFSFAQLGWPMT